MLTWLGISDLRGPIILSSSSISISLPPLIVTLISFRFEYCCEANYQHCVPHTGFAVALSNLHWFRWIGKCAVSVIFLLLFVCDFSILIDSSSMECMAFELHRIWFISTIKLHPQPRAHTRNWHSPINNFNRFGFLIGGAARYSLYSSIKFSSEFMRFLWEICQMRVAWKRLKEMHEPNWYD